MFSLTQEQQLKIHAWHQDVVYPAIIKEQSEFEASMGSRDESGNPIPYFGAIGGGTTYKFTPTSLGVVVQVESGGLILDVTNYDEW